MIIDLKYMNKHGEVECFYHVTTEDKDKSKRKLSIQRYETCLLIFLILDECLCDKISCQCIYIKKDYTNENRISIYCSKYRYVLILEEKSTKFEFITAFPVTDSNEYKFI